MGIHKENGKKVAIKIIEKKNVGEEYKKNLDTEMMILKKVDHPHIIKLEEMFETDDHLYLVMELYPFIFCIYKYILLSIVQQSHWG